MNDAVSTPPSRRKLLIGSGVAVAALAAIAVFVVLPAEYGIDPTGVGEAAGLTKIAEPGASPELERGMLRTGVLTLGEADLAGAGGASDHWTFELQPFEGIELKYAIDQGDAMAFRWQATGPLEYDMHAHPFDGGVDLTESYSIEEAAEMEGRYVAPFTGIHGWYWENRSLEPVTLTLDAAGGLAGSRTFDSTGEHERELTPPE